MKPAVLLNHYIFEVGDMGFLTRFFREIWAVFEDVYN